jgi:hypothetical protein
VGDVAPVTPTTVASTTVPELLAELTALADPRILEVNAKHGDDHAVNLSRLREVAKRLKGSRSSTSSRSNSGTPATPRPACWRS